ncbi:hypothetical protein PPERSA_10083 [Pseudocohnilembus persalinus]|uniref:Matrin-type domain-containing protein n=1 Tax=Pseudocohnilembus persalinus TaxID=266149 RepID=A0A0V0QJS8_PSEPJ|nr:hypothetical protein PPERSA_10083 [Pseudocohnilembus persalinus]|eukprot:KRX02466.1 hypothetical protein PPERSA_10083 [Pseudocohnilembus persalinus]
MVDRQHRGGARAGAVGMASQQDQGIELRERLKKLALESIDLKKDPYFLRNHIGTYECRLCLTLHTNEGSYLAHTQGKKHQTNLARRQAKDQSMAAPVVQQSKKTIPKPKTVKIGRPGYKIVKSVDQETGQKQIEFGIDYNDIMSDVQPMYRIMSAYEQKVEYPEKNYQYVVFAGDPYENIAFKVPNLEIDQKNINIKWDRSTRKYTVTIQFKEKGGRR